MMRMLHVVLSLFAFIASVNSQSQEFQKGEVAEKLGIAIDYFTSEKYHEALLIFNHLDNEFPLNPRFHAYMGVCQYYEWNYPEAGRLLSEALPKLGGLAPHELSVYYFHCAESYFYQEKYVEAIPYYEKHTNVCYNHEKGDALYRIAFCYLFVGNNATALEYFISSLYYYEKYSGNLTARITQIKNMINGLSKQNGEP
ncbi:tetratricopeptide repeat protein [Prevotella sp. OH937_COT-195]|uniref:tetratricopeptide repeat protein n=1 Tax=Prevotella sp. OH937_COT-195 TaxID=2491051 RepID=UPI000F647A75|nr:hypothetical protein [Prevotella sp. OH937_COT-195]RRD02191.1 hypothetical protein EII32_03865 [Prevotella sp. OH937_COT-195]